MGLVLEALSKSPYEPLREASLKHLTFEAVFLLAMASAGRRSELQALMFDQKHIQFKPKGGGGGSGEYHCDLFLLTRLDLIYVLGCLGEP